MPKVSEIAAVIEEFAPLSLACAWDNVGLIVGDPSAEVKCALAALDIDINVIKEAAEKNAELIITHHPVIFTGIKEINVKTGRGEIIYELIKNDISVYCAHTNLDAADGGTNDVLFDILGLREKEILTVDGYPLGCAGVCDNKSSLSEYVEHITKLLNVSCVKYAGDPKKIIRKVGFAAGSASGPEYFDMALNAGCDLYITGDISYHDAQDALNKGLCIIDAGHFATELPVVGVLRRIIEEASTRLGWGLKIHEAKQEDVFKYSVGNSYNS